jgi:hypothetical protein
MFDPSASDKMEFAAVVRVKMAYLGLTVFPYFTDATFVRADLKYVLPRPKSDLVLTASPPHLKATASAFPWKVS